MPLSVKNVNMPAGQIVTSPAVSSDFVSGNVMFVSISGLTQAQLNDSTLKIDMFVDGNDSPSGGTWYELVDDSWTGGRLEKDGVTIAPPEFQWYTNDVVTAQQYRLRGLSNKSIRVNIDITSAPVT